MWLKYYDEESPISFFYLLFYFVRTIAGCNRNRYRESVRRTWKGILILGEKRTKQQLAVSLSKGVYLDNLGI